MGLNQITDHACNYCAYIESIGLFLALSVTQNMGFENWKCEYLHQECLSFLSRLSSSAPREGCMLYIRLTVYVVSEKSVCHCKTKYCCFNK